MLVANLVYYWLSKEIAAFQKNFVSASFNSKYWPFLGLCDSAIMCFGFIWIWDIKDIIKKPVLYIPTVIYFLAFNIMLL